MIKFFRKIRYDLIKKNKAGKYFKYAIGEIILVVIGILIALQINTWNQNKLNIEKQTGILKTLLTELKKNQQQINAIVMDYEWIYSSSEYLSLNFNEDLKKLPNSRLDSLFGGVIYIPEYYPTTSVMDLVISTGQIQLIKNDSLKLAITLNNGLLPLYKMTARRAENVVLDIIYPKLEKEYPLKNILGGRLTNFGEFRKNDTTYKTLTIFKDLGLENAIELRRILSSDILVVAKMIQSSQENVILMIEEELR